MVTQVVTFGLYCPQTGEARHLQVWLHGGPFDAADDILTRLQEALTLTDTDWVEVVDERRSRNPHPVETRWAQLELDLVSPTQGPPT